MSRNRPRNSTLTRQLRKRTTVETSAQVWLVTNFEGDSVGHGASATRVTLTSGSILYARIRGNGDGTLEQEAWAMGTARRGGVHVPEVLYLDPASEIVDGLPVMIVAAAVGQPLTDLLPIATEPERRRLLHGVGLELARLHGIKTPGVWRPNEDGSWPDPPTLRAGFAADRRSEQGQLVAAGMTLDEVDRVMALLEVSADPPLSGFVLCHGDLSADHVFVAGGQVSGLIDWGMWHGGSRIGELAYVVKTFGWSALGLILVGYGDQAELAGPDLHQQLAIILAVLLIGHVAHLHSIGDPRGSAEVISVLRECLRVADRQNRS